MREEGVEELLKKANSGWEIVRSLVDKGKLVKLECEGRTFYMRKLPRPEETIITQNHERAKKIESELRNLSIRTVEEFYETQDD